MFEEVQFDKIIREVILNLFQKNLSLKDFELELTELLKRVAPINNTGKIEVVFKTKNKSENHRLNVVYDGAEVGEKYFQIDAPIIRNLIANVKCYPIKHYRYTVEDKKNISMLSNIIGSFYGNLMANKEIASAHRFDYELGVFNQVGIIEQGGILEKEEKLSDYAVVLMNLRNFGIVDKLFGSNNYNKVLRKYADKLISLMHSEELLGRITGDKFMLLLKKENVDEFIQEVKDIEIEYSNKKMNIQNYIGVYEVSKNDQISQAFERALVALEMAQKNKKVYYQKFDTDMYVKLLQKKEISYSFLKALKNDEFSVVYQPKVNLNTESLMGAEALVRWKNQKVSPAVFVPILEEENLIEELDFYVLEHVCRDMRNWIDQGINPVTVSTNFSRNNLTDPSLASKIVDVLKKYDIDHKYIEIEITETAGVENYQSLRSFIPELKKHNIRVSIDDFGTGYSSLNLLKDLNVDTIKIDKSFLDNYKLEKNRIVTRSIVQMLRELRISMLAEGVEKKDQVEFLKEIGCLNAQGYFYDRPLKEADYAKRLKHSNYKQKVKKLS